MKRDESFFFEKGGNKKLVFHNLNVSLEIFNLKLLLALKNTKEVFVSYFHVKHMVNLSVVWV